MSDPLPILRDLVATVNGQVRLWAVVLTVGPSYWLLTAGEDAPDRIYWFVVALVGVGLALGVTSIVMAIVARREEGRAETRRLDAEVRRQRMEAGQDDRTIYRIDP